MAGVSGMFSPNLAGTLTRYHNDMYHLFPFVSLMQAVMEGLTSLDRLTRNDTHARLTSGTSYAAEELEHLSFRRQ